MARPSAVTSSANAAQTAFASAVWATFISSSFRGKVPRLCEDCN